MGGPGERPVSRIGAMKADTRSPCADCQRLQAHVDALQLQLEAARAEAATLREQLAAARKDSSTSSKPPSSDIVKPKPPPLPEGTPRTIGGQPGHSKHERQPFPPEQVTHFEQHTLEACPCCGGPLRRNGD